MNLGSSPRHLIAQRASQSLAERQIGDLGRPAANRRGQGNGFSIPVICDIGIVSLSHRVRATVVSIQTACSCGWCFAPANAVRLWDCLAWANARVSPLVGDNAVKN